MQICRQPWVFGFNDCHFVRHILARDKSLMDSGVNSCIANSLAHLIDAVNITPFTFLIRRDGATHSVDKCCTKCGLLPLTMMDGSLYYQPCHYCKNAMETIISPQAIVNASDTFVTWHQTGHKGSIPGSIWFESSSGLLLMTLHLHSINGLYYCPLDVLTVDSNPVCPRDSSVSRIALDVPIPHHQTPLKYKPVSKECQLESEVWSLCLGCSGKSQLDVLPGNVSGLPSILEYHPFRFINFHVQACIGQQAAQRSGVRVEHRCKEFHMDFGFMRVSSHYYTMWYNLIMATPHT
jgi:hypothetical protein